MRKKTLAVFLIFTVLVALLAPTNASAYTKLGYVMTKSSAKILKFILTVRRKGLKILLLVAQKPGTHLPT